MEMIVEAFPFAFGVLLGISCHRFLAARARWLAWACGSLALGSFATLCSGEYLLSPVYYLFDIGLVAAVSAGVGWLLEVRQRRLKHR